MSLFDMTTFSDVFGWVIAHGYPLMLVAMLIEGPVVTAAASFAAVFGYFNILIIFMLSILGDLMADLIYYFMGYCGRIMFVQKYGTHFGLTNERIKKIEAFFNSHPKKAIVALKLTPVLPTPGLAIVGASRMPLKKFITVCSVVILPKTIFFMVLGYYFGSAYAIIYSKYKTKGLILGVIVFFIIGTYYASAKISAYIARKIEKNKS